MIYPHFFGLRESGGQGGRQQHGTDSKSERSNPWPGEARGRYEARACGLGCVHPVSQAHLACALFPSSSVCNILNYDDGAPRRTLSFAPPHFPSAEVHDGHLAALLDVGFKADSTVLLWRMRWWLLLIHWSGVVRLTLPPCSLEAVAEVWRWRGLRPRGWVHPGAPSELRIAKGYTDTPVHLAPLDVDIWLCSLHAFNRKTLTSWSQFACESSVSLQNYCQRSGTQQGAVSGHTAPETFDLHTPALVHFRFPNLHSEVSSVPLAFADRVRDRASLPLPLFLRRSRLLLPLSEGLRNFPPDFVAFWTVVQPVPFCAFLQLACLTLTNIRPANIE